MNPQASSQNEMNVDSYKGGIKKTQRTILVILAASVIVFLAIAVIAVGNEGFSLFASEISSINLSYYALALLCVFASDLIGFPKWQMFIKKLQIKIDWKKNLPIYLSMFTMDITPGRWGRAAISYTVNKVTGAKFAQIFPAVVADILTDFLGFIVIALTSAFLVHKYAIISIVISILLLIPFIFIYIRAPFDYIRRRFRKVKILHRIFDVGNMYFKNSRYLDFGTYVYAMIFTIPAMLLNGLALYLVILSVGIHLSFAFFPTILFIYTSSFLIGMVTGVPGTLGVTDAALLSYLTAFFPMFGITFGIASVITIFFRIANIWFVEGMSSLFFLYTLRYWKTDQVIKRTY